MSHLRRRRRPQASHTDDWLLTYADTITLLLCLFVLLLASQARKLGLIQKPVPAMVAEQTIVSADFLNWKPPIQTVPLLDEATDEDAYAGLKNSTAAPLEREPLLPSPARDALAATERTTSPVALDWQSTNSPTLAANVSLPPPLPLADPGAYLASSLFSMPSPEIVAGVRPAAAARIEQKGDRITTLAFDSAAFFSRGAATLNSPGKVILLEMINNLNSEEYEDYMITIEGHTDDTPINTAQFPSNWELSTARAAAVVRFFVEQGVSTQRVRASGYADTHPLQPNRDSAGIAIPENQAKNRRVVIGLEKIEGR